jgi:hypothetical protein
MPPLNVISAPRTGFASFTPADAGLPAGSGTGFGTALCQLGDVDGDGSFGLAVGSIGESATTSPFPEGAVHVVHLSSSGGVLRAATFNGTRFGASKVGDKFGASMVSMGDWGTTDADADQEEDDGNDDGSPKGIGLMVGVPGYNESTGCVVFLPFLPKAFAAGSDPYTLMGRHSSLCFEEVLLADSNSGSGVSGDDGGVLGAAAVGSEFGSSLAHVADGLVVVGSAGENSQTGSVWILNLTTPLLLLVNASAPSSASSSSSSSSPLSVFTVDGSGADVSGGLGGGQKLMLASPPIHIDTSALGLDIGDR